ncbi:MAG: galactose-1-phosphate uridylyltransferase [Sulfurospirillum sp.]|nr:galactose-1-phosphate uridylyltransferase [Sulfurospirillum sp.]
MSEIRYDKIHNQHVLIAPERLYRPNIDFQKKKIVTNLKRCPFCEGNEHLTPAEVFAIRDNSANTQGWKTRVVPNLYKAVQIELDGASRRNGIFEARDGLGAHEILIDSPKHSCGFESLGVAGIENWLRSIIIRVEDLQKDGRLIYVSVFKNVGERAGATQEHPHTQILALPMMPKNELVFLQRNADYYRLHGRGILEDVLHNELFFEKRILTSVGDFVAFCPYASAFSFEVMIVPTQNLKHIFKCSRKQVNDFAILLEKVFSMLAQQLGVFDYNLAFSFAPLNSNFENEIFMPNINKNYRFSLRIIPRIYTLGGFELASGMFINCVSPEESAKLLRGDKS